MATFKITMDVSKPFETLTINTDIPTFKLGSSERQYTLAFPKHVIDYINANPSSPKQWKKLIQTCKLWFDKNPIVVIQCLHFYGQSEYAQHRGWKTCSYGICNDDRPDQAINFVGKPIKLWITGKLAVDCAALSRTLVPQLYKCNVKEMNLFNDAISLEELSFITSSVTTTFIGMIKDKNGKLISFEEVIGCLPASLEAIDYFSYSGSWNSETFKKLAEMEHVQTIKKILLVGFFPTVFDFDGLFKFMIENKQIFFGITFMILSTTQRFMDKLKVFAEKIQNEDYDGYQRPDILLNGKLLVENNPSA